MERQMYEVVCDECGEKIEMDGQLLRERVIAQDKEGDDVTERFFECPHCGHHYTVIVIDRELKLMIQKRQQLQKRMKRAAKNRRQSEVKQILQEDRDVEQDIKARAKTLKNKYLEGGVM